MMTVFYSVGQLWYESRISWRLKRCLFISRVVNTALSSIEGVLPPQKHSTRRSRRRWSVLREELWRARRRAEEQVRTMTTKEVLCFWRLAPCDVEARVRRLKWAQTLVQNLAHHVQLVAAVVWEVASGAAHHAGFGR